MNRYETYLKLKARLGYPAPTSTPVTADALEAWQAKTTLSLPDDLEAFLLQYGDGAAGFAVKNGREVTREFTRLLALSDTHLASAARPCPFGSKGWLPRMPAYGAVMDLGFLELKVDKSMISKLDPETITDGCLTLGETMDGSFWMLALNGKARGKVFVWNAEHDYEGMRPTKKTFGQLMELWLEQAIAKLTKDVALLDAIETHGVKIWEKRDPEAVMKSLRGLLRVASAEALPRYLEVAFGCDTLGPLDGWPNEVTQELIWGLSTLLERGQSALLVTQLSKVLEPSTAARINSRQLVSDFITMALLADAADGKLELDYRAAYPRADGLRGCEVRRIGEACAKTFRGLAPEQQRVVLQNISPAAMLSISVGGLDGHVDDVIAKHTAAMRALVIELFRDIASTPTSLAGAMAVAEVSRALYWQRKKVPASAATLGGWLPMLAHGASLLQTPEGSYSAASLTKGLHEELDAICAATGTTRDMDRWRVAFDAELSAR